MTTPIFLTQLLLSPRNADARACAADVHAAHRLVMSMFPEINDSETPRLDMGILYRIEEDRARGAWTALVQSAVRPDPAALPHGVLVHGEPARTKETTSAIEAITNGMTLRFRLVASPSKCVAPVADASSARAVAKAGVAGGGAPDGGPGDNGGRGDMSRGRTVSIVNAAEAVEWLRRRGNACGFGFQEGGVDVFCEWRVGLRRRQGNRLGFGSARFNGILRVTDADAFRAAIRLGVGREKAFGMGLLSVATVG